MTPAQNTLLTGQWRKSSRSTGGNDYVEVAQSGTACLVRDSKNPEGIHLSIGPRARTAFLGHVKHGGHGS